MNFIHITLPDAGWEHAAIHGKLKENPHPGGTAEWWAWHNGYQGYKKYKADLDRRNDRRTSAYCKGL